MADIEPLKLRIWNDARADNWEQFNRDCEALIEKAVGDWWRIGWSLAPNTIDEIYHILDGAAKNAHESWLKAMEDGDAPAEDVSPGEGFLLVKKIIQDAVNGQQREVENGNI